MTSDTGITDTTRPERSQRTRTRLAAVSMLAVGVVTLSACGASGSDGTNASASAPSSASASASTTADTLAGVDAAAAKDASDARISITPKSGTSNAGINNGTAVTVTGGKLTDVTMTSLAGGAVVKGTISAGGTRWKPVTALARGAKYTVTATAQDARGRVEKQNSTFGTVSASDSFIGYYTPESGTTVGVGMPVSINFDKAITHKRAVQSAIDVSSSSGQRVVGHWFGSTRLDFRPQTYWKAGSDVTLRMKLNGVEGANNVTGVQDKTLTFHIGRSQVSTVDVKTKEMTVVRDGKVVKTIPVSAGAPDHPTYNGRMVISEQFEQTRMNGASVGFKGEDGKGEYDIPDVPHAQRLSSSGTFIHGNYWGAKSIFGSVNTSHGCIGLSDTKGAKDKSTPAAWFFANSLTGDVVVVKNSGDKTIQPDNGLNGWNMSWSDWTAGSAL